MKDIRLWQTTDRIHGQVSLQEWEDGSYPELVTKQRGLDMVAVHISVRAEESLLRVLQKRHDKRRPVIKGHGKLV